MRNPARGGNGNQHPYGDAILVSKRLESIPSAKVSIDLADMLPNWPYKWPDRGQNNQKWNLVDAGNGYYNLVNVNSGKYLDVEKGSISDGGNVIQWSSNNVTNQQWQIIAP